MPSENKSLKNKRKIHITPSNYYLIVNVSLKLSIVLISPLKLLIVLISPLKLPKHINVPSNEKNILHKFINFFFKKYIYNFLKKYKIIKIYTKIKINKNGFFLFNFFVLFCFLNFCSFLFFIFLISRIFLFVF
jgi:hypothetical protein